MNNVLHDFLASQNPTGGAHNALPYSLVGWGGDTSPPSTPLASRSCCFRRPLNPNPGDATGGNADTD